MGYFRVMLHGDGFCLLPEARESLRLAPNTSDAPITGFYTTRIVRARDEAHAVEMAIEATHEELRSYGFGKWNKGGGIKFDPEYVNALSPWQFFWAKSPRGFTFYSKDPDE